MPSFEAWLLATGGVMLSLAVVGIATAAVILAIDHALRSVDMVPRAVVMNSRRDLPTRGDERASCGSNGVEPR